MGQETLLRSLVNHMPINTLIDAARKDVNFDTAVANLTALFDAHLDGLQAPMDTAEAFFNYAHDYGSIERELSAEMVAAIDDIVCGGLRNTKLAPSDLHHRNWISAITSAVAKDQIGTLMKLDQAGLIERTKVGVGSALARLWEQAIINSAPLCNRYFLTTTKLDDLGGYPQEDLAWPPNTDLARDIVSHIPESELTGALDALNDRARYAPGSEFLQSAAEHAVAAMLERCAQAPERMQDPAFDALLSVMVAHSNPLAGNRMGSVQDAAIMLELMEKTGNLGGAAAFRYADYLIRNGKGGEWVSPDRLQSLLAGGLPIQSDLSWNKDGEARHLLVNAGICHFNVLDSHISDREAFIRDFGPKFATEQCKNEIAGVKNEPLMALAKMGYPFGAIAVVDRKGDGCVQALHDRSYGTARIDTFLVGHLCGHLSPADTWNELSPLHIAVGNLHVPTVKAFFKLGFSVDTPVPNDFYDYNNDARLNGYKGMAPIVVAVKKENPEMLRTLIDLGADVGVKAPTGATLMQLAKGDERIKQLIRSARTGNALGSALKDAEPVQEPGLAKKKPSVGAL